MSYSLKTEKLQRMLIVQGYILGEVGDPKNFKSLWRNKWMSKLASWTTSFFHSRVLRVNTVDTNVTNVTVSPSQGTVYGSVLSTATVYVTHDMT